MTGGTLIYFVTEDWYFLSHRMPMARAAISAGFNVAVITNVSTKRNEIEAAGIRVIPFPLQRKSLNPFTAVKQIMFLARIYRSEKPDMVHHVALKPVLFGSLAAWIANVPRVLNAFVGLGVIFNTDIVQARILRPILVFLFRILLRRRGFWTLFQNRDDMGRMLGLGVCDPARTVVIRGSGVDIDRYAVHPLPPAPPFICVMAGRMIESKGLPTLQACFEILREQSPHVRLWLCGQPDPGNPGSWNAARLNAWCHNNPNVIWKGHQDDMSVIWPQVHLALQPSYGGEGLPKALLEAGACGRAMVASDISGCREVVEHGRNGFLVEQANAQALADAITAVASDLALCATMGVESRKIIERDLSSTAIGREISALYLKITS